MADQASGFLSPWLRRRRMAIAGPFVQGRVLDYGCSTGDLCDLVPAKGDYFGYDIDPEVIDVARRLHADRSFSAEAPAPQGQFDTVVSLAVIEHVSDPVQFLSTLSGYLAPGGKIVLTTPNPVFEWAHHLGSKIGLFSEEADEEHESLLQRQDLVRLAEDTGLALEKYQRFLFGANQLAVYAR